MSMSKEDSIKPWLQGDRSRGKRDQVKAKLAIKIKIKIKIKREMF